MEDCRKAYNSALHALDDLQVAVRFEPPNNRKTSSHREMEPMEEKEGGCCSGFVSCLLGLALFSSQLIIFGVVALTVYWVFKFRGGIDIEKDPLLQFNLHIILMIIGFVFFCGQAILSFRVFDCCKRSYARFVHLLLQLLGTACITVGFYVTFMHTHNQAVAHFRSVHTWLALATCGLFVFQLVFALFCFVLLLCCRRRSFSLRQRLVPVHASCGLVIFAMFACTAITGFIEAQSDQIILPASYNQTAENILSLIPGSPKEQSDLIVKMLSCGLLALVVLLPTITNTSIRGGRGVFYRTN
ncbi:cytochrome b561-like isoform X2 [Varroa destructor]|uniref:Cytochrome b561 domain-containing protein n=1 Tax=Varroa destructor TaxID=109461 RepID=A0A7M7MDG2_VARDE|nr:cytochrome b561-like isoform X2 [Varroa destructor]